ncbi:zinc-dependent metalloprotease, partial [bacterium]|nr:zinc-dependent metalloprotease [bacterium]
EALIGQAIELSNESYENSQVALQLRTVHVAQTTDNESGSLVEDLTNLQGSTDGSFDEAHTLRNTYGADMVVLMTAPGDYCGIGYSPSTVAGLASGTYAFSVVASNCVDYYSFQHEVGHNLGLQHDPDNAPEATAYEGSYGHRWNAEESGLQYRSVMAYAPGTRVPYFSNPDVSHEGSRTGLSTEADNASTLSIVSAVAANYRATASLPEVEEGEEEEEEEEEEENGGETTEGGNENGGEVESPSGNETPETLTVDQESTRRATTFELVVTDTEGAALANVEVSFFLLKKNGNRKLLSTVTTDALGGYSYRIKKRRKKQKIVISTEGLPEIFETIRKKKGKRNRRRRR